MRRNQRSKTVTISTDDLTDQPLDKHTEEIENQLINERKATLKKHDTSVQSDKDSTLIALSNLIDFVGEPKKQKEEEIVSQNCLNELSNHKIIVNEDVGFCSSHVGVKNLMKTFENGANNNIMCPNSETVSMRVKYIDKRSFSFQSLKAMFESH